MYTLAINLQLYDILCVVFRRFCISRTFTQNIDNDLHFVYSASSLENVLLRLASRYELDIHVHVLAIGFDIHVEKCYYTIMATNNKDNDLTAWTC